MLARQREKSRDVRTDRVPCGMSSRRSDRRRRPKSYPTTREPGCGGGWRPVGRRRHGNRRRAGGRVGEGGTVEIPIVRACRRVMCRRGRRSVGGRRRCLSGRRGADSRRARSADVPLYKEPDRRHGVVFSFASECTCDARSPPVDVNILVIVSGSPHT